MSPLPTKTVGVAVIWNQQHQILIDRRLPGGAFGGLWEFPGGKIAAGETVTAGIAREVQEELALKIAIGPQLMTVSHNYSQFQIELHVYHCYYQGGAPQLLACDAVAWVEVDQLEQYPFPEANGAIITALQTNPTPPEPFPGSIAGTIE
jgi:mutator protein MutT